MGKHKRSDEARWRWEGLRIIGGIVALSLCFLLGILFVAIDFGPIWLTTGMIVTPLMLAALAVLVVVIYSVRTRSTNDYEENDHE